MLYLSIIVHLRIVRKNPVHIWIDSEYFFHFLLYWSSHLNLGTDSWYNFKIKMISVSLKNMAGDFLFFSDCQQIESDVQSQTNDSIYLKSSTNVQLWRWSECSSHRNCKVLRCTVLLCLATVLQHFRASCPLAWCMCLVTCAPKPKISRSALSSWQVGGGGALDVTKHQLPSCVKTSEAKVVSIHNDPVHPLYTKASN